MVLFGYELESDVGLDRLGVLVLFFFSSRRRHTRSLCDWSSDVCSSDLTARVPEQATAEAVAATGLPLHIGGHMHFNGTNDYRSEERRGGEECRFWWSAYH